MRSTSQVKLAVMNLFNTLFEKRYDCQPLLAIFALVVFAGHSPLVRANDITINQCLQTKVLTASNDHRIGELKQQCQQELAPLANVIKNKGAISKRILAEQQTEFDPYVITPHDMNYIMPFSVTSAINRNAYSKVDHWSENLAEQEARFQLSIKVPLNSDPLFTQGDGLYFGFTLQSWWQVYSDNISKPFRETNYKPELFYLAPTNWHPFGGNVGYMLGIEHQSNGRTQLLSRSWNRLYLNLLYEKNDFALSFRPWWRLPEQAKETPLSSDGDDNPDISDYMGHFEFAMAYQYRQYELQFKGRQNFATHHGFFELGLTFPLWGKLKGYTTFSQGYGESLIDYNHAQKRFGIGLALTDIL